MIKCVNKNKYVLTNNLFNSFERCKWFDEEDRIIADYILLEVPIEDVAPVIHAHWIVDKESDENTCSHCGGIVDFGDAKTYCQYCGAKMDEVIK